MSSQNLLIKNAVIYTQDNERRVFRGSIEITRGKITGLFEGKKGRSARGSRKVLDARGAVILPGFIQPHIHLCQTLFRNLADDLELLDWLRERIWPMEAAHTYETLYTSALLGIHELLRSGTTCILDMATVHHTGAVFAAVQKSGIRANVGKCLMDHPKNAPKGLREKTDDALKEAEALFKKWNGKENGRIRASFAPRFTLSCTEKLLRAVGKLSAQHGALIHTHANENKKEVVEIQNQIGEENLIYLSKVGLLGSKTVLAHCVWMSPDEYQTVRNTQTHVTHCPGSNLKLASGFAPVPQMLKHGINVALAADGAPCNNQLNAFQEMKLAATIHKPSSGPTSMTAQTVLDMMTRNGAKALNWEDEIGSIEVGKSADLVVLDLLAPNNYTPTLDHDSLLNEKQIASSIVYSTSAENVFCTMVQGKILFDGKKVPTIPALMKRVPKAQKLLRSKLKNI